MHDCPNWIAWVVLVIGVLHLLTDLSVITWWVFNWWTTAFVLIGLCAVTNK